MTHRPMSIKCQNGKENEKGKNNPVYFRLGEKAYQFYKGFVMTSGRSLCCSVPVPSMRNIHPLPSECSKTLALP